MQMMAFPDIVECFASRTSVSLVDNLLNRKQKKIKLIQFFFASIGLFRMIFYVRVILILEDLPPIMELDIDQLISRAMDCRV